MSKTDLERWHPTNILETGYDILFFWVARMILMTEYALKTIPFQTVYLHGLVRDTQGRKMSKSLGNTIEPLAVAEKFGTDAVRLSLVVGTTPGNDLKLSEQKIEGYRNFVNKLWNIARFVSTSPTNYPATAGPPDRGRGGESHTNLRIDTNRHPELVEGSQNATSYKLQATSLSLSDRWILSRLQRVIKDVTDDLEAYRFSQAAETLRAFTWDELADWYIETSKWQMTRLVIPSERSESRDLADSTISVLHEVLQQLLKLWHPFTPFVTEAIWQELKETLRHGSGSILPERSRRHTEDDLLLIADWPKPEKKWLNPKAEKTFAQIQAIVREIRSARSDFSIPPTAVLDVSIKASKAVIEQLPLVGYLTKTTFGGSRIPRRNQVTTRVTWLQRGSSMNDELRDTRGVLRLHPDVADVELLLDAREYINLKKETARIQKTITETETRLAQLTAQLKNKDFTAKAPKDIISTKRADLAATTARLQKLKTQLQNVQR